MEAKDTVMAKHQAEVAINPMLGLIQRFFGVGEKVTGRDALLVTAQAKISFKAGYDEGIRSGDYWEGLIEGRHNGIREVVEWVDKRLYGSLSEGYGMVAMTAEEWQAKLEEWGINLP